MPIGLVGRKNGMTRIFTDSGQAVPVTVISVEANRISQIKTSEVDGYSAIQVTIGRRRPNRVTKAQAGHHAKAKTAVGRKLVEFRATEQEQNQIELGGQNKVDIFSVGQKVDVTANSKGKGYAGVIKRHNFRTQDATHGNSLSHRAAGSIGQCQDPGRVFKGKKMAGRMGGKRVTVQSLEVVRVDTERNVVLVKGAVPGATGGDVIIRPAVKKAATAA
jgi:large subunit ribosomal protein L3